MIGTATRDARAGGAALLLLAGAFASLPTVGAAQDTRPGIAVLPFENGGSYGKDKEDFDALRKGLAGTLIYELAQNPAVRLVDAARLDGRIRLFDQAVGCGSCHSVYSMQPKLLVTSNLRSRLCLSCHVE